MDCDELRVGCAALIRGQVAAGVALVLLLAGCGSADQSAAEKQKAIAAQSAAARAPDSELVAAVQSPGGSAPVTLRFEVPQRPVPGASFSVRLQAAATQGIESLQADFETSPGLEVMNAASARRFGRLQAGSAANQTLQLRAPAEGVFELTAKLSATTATGATDVSTFSIPLIVAAATAAGTTTN